MSFASLFQDLVSVSCIWTWEVINYLVIIDKTIEVGLGKISMLTCNLNKELTCWWHLLRHYKNMFSAQADFHFHSSWIENTTPGFCIILRTRLKMMSKSMDFANKYLYWNSILVARLHIHSHASELCNIKVHHLQIHVRT